MSTLMQSTNLSEDVDEPFECNVSHPEGGRGSEHGLRNYEIMNLNNEKF